MVTLNVRKKLIALVMTATIIPFVAINYYWISTQHSTLLNNSKESQAAVANDDADDVNLFVVDEIRALIYRSQDISTQQTSTTAQTTRVLQTLLAEDGNIRRITAVGKTGQETVALGTGGVAQKLQNDSKLTAFEAVKQSDNQYLSSAVRDSNGHPLVTIAVPIMTNTTPDNLASLLNDNVRPAGSSLVFNGALIAQVDFEVLWSGVLSSAINAGAPGSYAYVVDNQGNVIAYPNQTATSKHNFADVPIVSDFMHHVTNPADTDDVADTALGKSETGTQVLATYQKIDSVDWAIVDEDPVTNIYKDINRVTEIGTGVAIIAIIILGILSLLLADFFVRPILAIAAVAERIGKGDLDARIDKNRRDEIGTLSQNINTMGQNLKLAIGKVEDQRHQLEAILDNTTDAIMSIGSDGKLLVANTIASKFFDTPPETLIGQDIATLLSTIETSKPVKLGFADLTPGVNIFTDIKFVSPTKSTHYIDLVAVKVEGSGTGIGTNQVILTIHDETKRRELDNLKVDFVSMAAHELRTPLSAVQGYLELAALNKQRVKIPEDIKRYIDHAQMSARELGSLMSNLLSVSRLEHGTLNLHMEKVDVAVKAKETVKSLQFNAQARQIDLTYVGPDDNCDVTADPLTLQEVVNNLVDNAIKYTRPGGKVTVALATKLDKYELSVTDSGIGIAKEALPNLFTKFYRVHSGLETGSAGTGLGLYLAKTILDNFDGHIAVESEVGKGSVFTITLPLFSDQRFREIMDAQPDDGFNNGGTRAWTTKNTPR